MILLLFGCDSGSQNNQILTAEQQISEISQSRREGKTITVTSAADIICVPDKIIYYHKGQQAVIEKGSEKYDTIVKMARARASYADDIIKSAIRDSDLDAARKNNDLIEFVYSDLIKVDWNHIDHHNKAFTYRFEYTSIFFPLTGEFNELMIFKPKSSGPVGRMGAADELLKYL